MVSHDYFEELIPLYALGALSGAEIEQIKHHLQGCASCRAQYRKEVATVGMLPRSVEAVQPSKETKLKLFARVDADLSKETARVQPGPKPAIVPPASQKRAWYRQPAFAFAVVAAIILLAVGGWILLQNMQSSEQGTIASILNDPNVHTIALNGTKDAPDARAEISMVPGHSQAVLKVSGLQPLPADKGYEFWFIRGNDPQASNVFTVNSDGTGTVLVKANDKVENFNAWGVSIEPREGVAKPTGPIVILGGG